MGNITLRRGHVMGPFRDLRYDEHKTDEDSVAVEA